MCERVLKTEVRRLFIFKLTLPDIVSKQQEFTSRRKLFKSVNVSSNLRNKIDSLKVCLFIVYFETPYEPAW
jgi:hypothetical protein